MKGALQAFGRVAACRRCGTLTAPHPTGENLCGPCWRHLSLRAERMAQRAAHDGRIRARKGAR